LRNFFPEHFRNDVFSHCRNRNNLLLVDHRPSFWTLSQRATTLPKAMGKMQCNDAGISIEIQCRVRAKNELLGESNTWGEILTGSIGN
jgi:hypothetical protein